MSHQAASNQLALVPPGKVKFCDLTFSKYAWLKMEYMCQNKDHVEVGGFCRTDPEDMMRVIDVVMIKQENSSGFVDFDTKDGSLANYFEDELAAGRPVRIWWHTHPGDSAAPSSVDEDCLSTEYSECNYFIMFIMSRSSNVTARLRTRIEGTNMFVDTELRVMIEKHLHNDVKIDTNEWLKEYNACVNVKKYQSNYTVGKPYNDSYGSSGNFSNGYSGGNDRSKYGKAKKKIGKKEAEKLAKSFLEVFAKNDTTEYEKLHGEYEGIAVTDQAEIDEYIREHSKYKGGVWKDGLQEEDWRDNPALFGDPS